MSPAIFKILDNKIGRYLGSTLFIILYENNRRRLLIISKYIVSYFFKIILSPFNLKFQRKINQDFLSFWISLVRNPDSIMKSRDRTLRVCITYKCNLTCKSCYAKGLINEIPEDMNLNDFKRLVLWAKKNNFFTIRMLGGEPTIHPQFVEMLETCYQNLMFVSFSTNNLFLPHILAKLERFWMHIITVNYTVYTVENFKDDKRKTSLFKKNLEELNKRRIPFAFSYILGKQDGNVQELLKDIENYRPNYIAITLEIPASSGQIHITEIINRSNSIYAKISLIQETAIKLNIPFFVYRPLLLCMFAKEQWEKLRNIIPFTVFSRCPIGYRDNYIRALTVNPDLTIFPCPSLFIRGPKIFSFKDRDTLNRFYKDRLKRAPVENVVNR